MADLYNKVRFQPVVQPDGTLGPSKEEFAYAQEKAAEGGFLEMNRRYEELNKTLQKQSQSSRQAAGLSPAPVSLEEATRFARKSAPPEASFPSPKAPAMAATSLTEKEKLAVEPTSPPGGKADQAAPPVEKDGIPAVSGQDKTGDGKQDDIEKAISEWGKLQATVAAGKGVSRGKLESALNELEKLKPADPTSPDTKRFVQARADAYRAYQEKADRNDWLEVAQNLVGAITNFASAKSAMGTPFIGGVPLKGIDYGARTERAGKEYGMELGQIGAEEKAAETAAEREDRLKREQFIAKRGALEERITAEREKVREGEAAQREAGRETMSLLRDIMNTRRSDAKNATYLAEKTKEIQAKGRQAAVKDIDSQLNSLVAQEKAVTAKLKAANNLMASTNKTYSKALADYATAAGVSEESLKEQADKESGLFTFDDTYMRKNIAGGHAKELSAEQQQLIRQIESLRKLKSGGQAAPLTTAPTTQSPVQPSTTPPSGDNMVTVQLSTGKPGRIPASQLSKFLQDNPGSRQVQ